MLDSKNAFSGFSVDDLAAAKRFYGDTLGLEVTENEGGMLSLQVGSESTILIYPKDDHRPASFTILNFGVSDVEATVDELNQKGVTTKIYDDMGDEKGIQRGWGPDIAWFTDPAGNVLSVIATV